MTDIFEKDNWCGWFLEIEADLSEEDFKNKLIAELRNLYKGETEKLIKNDDELLKSNLENYRKIIESCDNYIIEWLKNYKLIKNITIIGDYDEGFDEFIKDFWKILEKNSILPGFWGIREDYLKMITLLKQRFDAVKEIWKIKRALKIKPLQAKRWEDVLESVKKISLDNWIEDWNFIEELWNRIHKYSLELEGKIKDWIEIKTIHAK